MHERFEMMCNHLIECYSNYLRNKEYIISNYKLLIYILEEGIDEYIEEVIMGEQKEALEFVKIRIKGIDVVGEPLTTEQKYEVAEQIYDYFIQKHFCDGVIAGSKATLKYMLEKYANEVLKSSMYGKIEQLNEDDLCELVESIYNMSSKEEFEEFIEHKLPLKN